MLEHQIKTKILQNDTWENFVKYWANDFEAKWSDWNTYFKMEFSERLWEKVWDSLQFSKWVTTRYWYTHLINELMLNGSGSKEEL